MTEMWQCFTRDDVMWQTCIACNYSTRHQLILCQRSSIRRSVDVH